MDRFALSYTRGIPTAIIDRITTQTYYGTDIENLFELLCALEDESRNLSRAWSDERRELAVELEELNYEYYEQVRMHEQLVDSLNADINELEDEIQALRAELQSQALRA